MAMNISYKVSLLLRGIFLLSFLCAGCSKKVTEQNLIGTWEGSNHTSKMEIKDTYHFVLDDVPENILDGQSNRRVNGNGKWRLLSHSIPYQGVIEVLFYFDRYDGKKSYKMQQMFLSCEGRTLEMRAFVGDPDEGRAFVFTKIK